MPKCSLIFDTYGEMEECINWCRRNAVITGCDFLDYIDDDKIDSDTRYITAKGLIFDCDMSMSDFIKFKMFWSHTFCADSEYK